MKFFLSLPISFPILVNVIPYQIYIQNTQITVFNFFQPNLEHYQYYKNAPRAKRKFLQVEDMPGTQTLVNLVSILSACKQDFLYHKNDPIFSSKCLETSDLSAWEALPRYNSELMIIMKSMLYKHQTDMYLLNMMKVMLYKRQTDIYWLWWKQCCAKV